MAETQLIHDGLPVTDAAIAERVTTLSSSDIGDKVLPHFIVNKLPVGIAGLLIAAIFAAAMSSMDTSLNSSATLWLCDIHKRYLRPQAGEKESMKVLHLATLVFGVAGTLTAIAMIRVKSALDAWWTLQGIFTGGVLGLFLLGIISKRAKNPQAVFSVLVGIFLIVWLALSNTDYWPSAWSGWASPFQSFLTIVFGTSSIVLIGVIVALFKSKPKEQPANGETRNL